jgi:hypothetical protein
MSLFVSLLRIKLLTQVICILHTESLYPVKTKYIVADFSSGRDIYEKIGKQLIPLDDGILVNDVGTGLKTPGYFETLQRNYCGTSSTSILEQSRS